MARKTLVQRFEEQVDRRGVHHVWLGGRNPERGTGRLSVAGQETTAHRVAWELVHGGLPPATRVLSCPEQPACVRIGHLSVEGPPDGTVVATPIRRGPKGAGYKREVRPGVWELSLTAGRDEFGRKRRAFRTFQGREVEATKALAAFVAEVGAGDALPSSAASRVTVAVLLEEYLQHLDQDKGRKHSTLVRYRGLTRTWVVPTLGSTRLSRVLPQDVEKLLGGMRRASQSQSSIHQVFTLLNGAFKWAKRNRRMTSNPLVDVEEPRSAVAPREVVPPDLASLLLLLATALAEEYEFGVALHVGAATGMRRGELAGLRWTSVDLVAAQVRVETTVNDAGGKVVLDDFTKTRRSRRVSLDLHTIATLRLLRERMQERAALCGTAVDGDAFVFSLAPDCATPMRPEYLTRRMRQLRRRLSLETADFDATLHALRHWTQTALAEAGYNTRQVARRGGHSPQVMERVYVHRTAHIERDMTAYIGDLLVGAEEPGTRRSVPT